MKQLISVKPVFFFLITALLSVNKSNAQCMLIPASLESRLSNSPLVVEGIVQAKQSKWDDKHQLIFTIYTIKPSVLFKGQLPNETIDVVAKGGTVGNMKLQTTNQIELEVGMAGIFMLQVSRHAVSTGHTLFECVSDVQGLIKYDAADKSAAGVFDVYKSVETDLYKAIETKLGKKATTINELNWNKLKGAPQTKSSSRNSENSTAVVAAISGFSPTSIAAGSKEILTISGSGFGSTQGTSYVQFKNANDGGGSWISPAAGEYVSWTDTQIQVEVPTVAGTGQIRVVTGSTSTSASSLTVTYNLTNITGYNSDAYFPTLYNVNGSGGYTFTYSTDITTNANTYFTKALTDWVCNSDINWYINSSTTTIDVVAYDNVSVVRYGTLASSTLGETSVWFASCSSNTAWVILEVDMTFNSSSNFYYGTGTPGGTQYDFYSVALHELGHAFLLGHVINSGTMMHYAISGGATARTFTASQETAGAADVMAQCVAGANCGFGSLTTSGTTACSVPTVTLSTGAASINENGGSTTVTATLSASYPAPVTITLATSGTATSGTDYTALTTTITIAAGSTSGSVTLTSIDDAVFEGNETVIINITGVTNGTENGTQQSTVTITDNESGPSVSISSSFHISTEGGSGLTITATLSATSSLATTVNFSFSGTAIYGTDYTMNSSITIPAGSTSATTSLVPVDDADDEAAETIIIDVSSVTNGTENGTQQLTITLNDNDPAPSVTLSSSAGTIAEAAGSSTITATLSAYSYQDITVTLTATGTATGSGTDYTLGSTSLVIPAGSLTATTTVTAVQDALDEDDETVILNITAVTNGSENGTQVQTITITDDDASPTVTLSTGSTSILETAGSTTVTATLSAVSGRSVTVNIAKTGTATVTTDYTLGNSITIPAGSSSASITLNSVSDVIDEDDETVIIDISSVTNGTENGTQQRTVTITDDDAAPTVTLSAGAASIAEAAGSTTFTATLSAASSRIVTVNLAISGTATGSGTDYSISGTTITIAAGSTTGSITVTAVQDAMDEDDETVIADISSVTNGTENGTQQQTISITDDDATPTVTLNLTANSIGENGAGALVAVGSSAVSGRDITVTVAIGGTATVLVDHTAGSTVTVTIPAGSTASGEWIYSINDALDEDNETITAEITAVTNGTESGTQSDVMTITDDDATPTVTIAWSNTSIGEGPAGTSNAIATLSAVSGRTVTINLAWSGTATLNTDYTVTGSTITIPAGSPSGFVTMNNLTDNLYEMNGGASEVITVTMSSATNATLANPSAATMTQNDDDPAPTVTLSTAASAIAENGGTTTVTITQSAVSGVNTTITITATGTATEGVDYNMTSLSTIIPAGSASATITVTGINDAVTEGSETIILDITAVTNGTESGTQQRTVNIIEGALPVKFSSVKAIAIACNVNINFSTTFEQNNRQFEVQWSTNSINWISIDTIVPTYTNGTEAKYSYKHTSPVKGINYYRIKQVDNDGKETYSPIVNASINCDAAIKAAAYPNPFTDALQIKNLPLNSLVSLYSADGKLVYQAKATNTTHTISAGGIARGKYILSVTDAGSFKQVIQLVK